MAKDEEIKQGNKVLYKFNRNNLIGEGTYGKVYQADDLQMNLKIALKIQIFDDVKKLKREKKVIETLIQRGPFKNIVRIYNVFLKGKQLYTAMELGSGSFDQFLKKSKQHSQNQNFKIMLAYQIINGLHEIQSIGFMHRDIKPQNIIYFENSLGKIILKICDIGETRSYNEQGYNSINVGTCCYMAPEMNNEDYDQKVDVWSAGLVLYEIFSSKILFPENLEKNYSKTPQQQDIIKKIDKIKDSDQIKTLLKNIIVVDPSKRFDYQQVQQEMNQMRDSLLFNAFIQWQRNRNNKNFDSKSFQKVGECAHLFITLSPHINKNELGSTLIIQNVFQQMIDMEKSNESMILYQNHSNFLQQKEAKSEEVKIDFKQKKFEIEQENEEETQLINEAINFDSDSFEISKKRGNVLKQLKNEENQIKSYWKAVKLIDEKINQNPYAANLHFRKAEILTTLEFYEEAIFEYDLAITLSDGKAEYYLKKDETLNLMEINLEPIYFGYNQPEPNPLEVVYHFRKAFILDLLGCYDYSILCLVKVPKLFFNFSNGWNQKSYNIINHWENQNKLKSKLHQNLIDQPQDKQLQIISLYNQKALFYRSQNLNPLQLCYLANQQYQQFQDYTMPDNQITHIVLMQIIGEKALKCFDAAISHNSENSYYYFQKGTILLKGSASFLMKFDKIEEAIEVFEEAISVACQQNKFDQIIVASYYCKKGDALAQISQIKDAIDCYNNAMKFDPKNQEYYNKNGEILIKYNKWYEALQVYDKLIELDHCNIKYLEKKSQCLSGLQKYQEADQCYDLLIKQNQNNPEYYYKKGIVLSQLSRFTAAVENFDLAIILNPQQTEFYHKKVEALENQKKYSEAVQCYLEIIDFFNPKPEYYEKLANVLMKLKEYEMAVYYYSQAISINRTEIKYQYQKAYALCLIDQFNQALIESDSALNIIINDKTSKFFQAIRKQKIKEILPVEAMLSYDEIIKRNPHIAYFYFKKAYFLQSLQSNVEALDCYDQALKLKPNEVKYLEGKAQILSRLRRYKEELICYEQLLKLNHSENIYKEKKVQLLQQLKQYHESFIYLNILIQDNPNCIHFHEKRGLKFWLFYLVEILKLQKKYQDAIFGIDDLIRLDKQNSRYYFEKATVLAELKQYFDAVECFGIGVEMESSESSLIQIQGFIQDKIQAEQILFDELLEQVIDSINKVILAKNLNSKELGKKLYSIGRNQIKIIQGMSFLSINMFEDAIKYFDLALNGNIQEGNYFYKKGLALSYTNKHEEAIICYDKAIEINYLKANYFYNKGESLAALSQHEEAIINFEIALDLDPKEYNYHLLKGNQFFYFQVFPQPKLDSILKRSIVLSYLIEL